MLRIGKKTLECHATLSCFCVMSYTDMLQSVQLEWQNISMWRNKSKSHYIIFPTKGKNCQFLWYCEEYISHNYPASIYMFKVNNKNTTTRCEICSKLTIKTRRPEHRHWLGRRVTQTTSGNLTENYNKLPSTNSDVEQVTSEFYNKHGFLQGIGAIDGTHITI